MFARPSPANSDWYGKFERAQRYRWLKIGYASEVLDEGTPEEITRVIDK